MDKAPNQKGDRANLGRKNLRTRIVAVALFFPLAIGMVRFLHHRSSFHREKKPKEEPKVKSVLHLDPFVVNLADQEGDRFLRVGIDLGLEREQEEHGQPAQAAMSLARARDTILSILTASDAAALVSPAGKAILKDQLTKALREHTPELGVREIYFTEFLIQR